jgi:hypothetical protein
LSNRKLKLKELLEKDFYQKIYSYKKNKGTGLSEQVENKIIHVKNTKNTIEFHRYNRTFDIERFKKEKQFLEFIYEVQLEDPKVKKTFWPGDQSIIVFYKQNFKEIENYELKNYNPYTLFLGIDHRGNEIYTDSVYSQNALINAGSSGSGKTTTLKTMAKTFLYHNPSYGPFIIIDTKSRDYADIGEYYNLEDIQNIKKLNEEIKTLIAECEKYNKQGLKHPNPRGLICDEALDYLGDLKLYDKETRAELEILQKNVQILIRKMRSQGIFVLIGLQETSSVAIKIPSSLIHTKLYSRVATVAQAQALNATKDLLDDDLKMGRFIRISGGTEIKVQTPRSINEKYDQKKIILKEEELEQIDKIDDRKESEEERNQSDTSETEELTEKNKMESNE